MSTLDTTGAAPASPPPEEDRRRRRRLWILLLLLLLLIVALSSILIIYLINPEPLPDLLNIDTDYAPHYLFSIYEVDQPVGVAVTPDGDLIYVSESGGERLINYVQVPSVPRLLKHALGNALV